MSAEIEFNRKAYKTKFETKYGKKTYYILIAKGGSNNLRNADGTIVKEWYVITIGNWYEAIRKIIDMSKSAEGGGLRYGNGSTKPENYIKNWRKTLKNAKPLKHLRKKITAQYNKNGLSKEQINFLKNREWKEKEEKFLGEAEIKLEKTIQNAETLKQVTQVYHKYDGKMNKKPYYKIGIGI